jgi:hypothetical protein
MRLIRLHILILFSPIARGGTGSNCGAYVGVISASNGKEIHSSEDFDYFSYISGNQN